MRRALGTALAAGIVAGLLGGLPAATAAPSSPAAVTAAASTTSPAAARPSTRPTLKYKVLVLHPAVVSKADRAGINALRTLGRERGFTLETTSDASAVTADNLSSYRAVVFLNTTGACSTPRRRPRSRRTTAPAAASSASARRSRPSPTGRYLTELLGTRADGAAVEATSATIKVADRVHVASRSLPGVLDAHRPLVQLRRQRPRRLARARDGRRDARTPAAR